MRPSATMQTEPPQPLATARAAADGGAVGAGTTEDRNLPKLRIFVPDAPAAQAARCEQAGLQQPTDMPVFSVEADADAGLGC